MNVRLPDGTIIKNVPDNITKAQLATKLQASGYDVPASWLPRESPAIAAKRAALKAAQAKTDSQYDAAMKAAQPNAAEDFVAGLGHHLGNIVVGPTQLAMHGINALSGGNLQGATNAVDNFVKQNEADYQRNIPTNAASVSGAAVGEIAPFLVGDALPGLLDTAGTKAASFIPESQNFLRRLISGATQGTAIAGASPVTTDGEYWWNKARQMLKGGAIGGILPAAASVTRGAANAATNLFRPQTVADANIARLFGASPDTVNTLRSIQPSIPGEQPTTAQALGGARPIAAEKAFGNTPEGKIALAERSAQNNEARINSLRGLAGTDEDMDVAIRARRSHAQAFINDKMAGARIDPSTVEDALNRLSQSGLGKRSAIKFAVSKALKDLKDDTGKDGLMDAEALDAMRQNISDYLREHAAGLNSSVSTQEEAAFDPIRNQIIRALDGQIRGYRNYLATYARDSVPINTMETARAALGPAANGALDSGGHGVLTLARLNSAFGKAEKSKYGLTPQAKNTLLALREGLQRESLSNSLRSPGSDTNYNAQAMGWLANSLSRTNSPLRRGLFAASYLGGAGLGYHGLGIEGAGIGFATAHGINSSVDSAAKVLNARMIQKFNEGVMDPAKAADSIQRFLDSHKKDAPALLRKFPQWKALIAPDRDLPEPR